MKRVPGYRVLACVLFVACFTATASGANLYYILLCDTLDPNIGADRDLSTAYSWARSIADHTGLLLRPQNLFDERLTVANARAALNAIDPGPDDVVFFHYSGHGGNPGMLKWPIFYFVSSPPDMLDAQRISFDEVVGILRPKNPRLLVILADTCNSFPDPTGRLNPRAPEPSGTAMTAAYRDLFLNFSGTILTSGSKPGQYSYGDWIEGGLYTSRLINAMYSLAVSQSPLTWEAVLAKAAADTTAKAAEWEGIQEPQYEIDAGAVADPTPSGPGTTPTGDTPGASPLAAPIPLCGATGLLPLAACVTGLWLTQARRRRWG